MLEDPGVPTLSTLLPELEYESWLGVRGPRGLPPRVLERLNREIREIATSPEISARIHALGAMPRSSTPESFAPAVSARSHASRACRYAPDSDGVRLAGRSLARRPLAG